MPAYMPVEFALRFTTAERAAMRAAAVSNTAVADGKWLLEISHKVVTTSPGIIAWMDALVTASVLTPARRTAILA